MSGLSTAVRAFAISAVAATAFLGATTSSQAATCRIQFDVVKAGFFAPPQSYNLPPSSRSPTFASVALSRNSVTSPPPFFQPVRFADFPQMINNKKHKMNEKNTNSQYLILNDDNITLKIEEVKQGDNPYMVN